MRTLSDAQERIDTPRWTKQERARLAAQVAPARKARGWSQDELASAAAVSRGTVGNIEGGEKVPQADNLARVLDALDLRASPADAWPEDVQGWLAVLAPLIDALPDEGRESTMLRVLRELTRPDMTIRYADGTTRDVELKSSL